MGLQLPTGRTTVEFALRVGAADGARCRARALRPTRHALSEETLARHAAQIALRRGVRRGRGDVNGDDNDDDSGGDDDVVDSDREHEDRRADGDRRHADGREDAAAGAPGARDQRGRDAQSTPGRERQEEEMRDRADHPRIAPYSEETVHDHRWVSRLYTHRR